MQPRTDQLDRACGVLLGQACGDALGVPYEGGPPRGDDTDAVMKGGGYGPYDPAEWSDDTQMALCIATVSASGTNLTSTEALDEIAHNFIEWQLRGATDIGIQTAAVLSQARGGREGAAERCVTAARQYAQRHRDSAAGNGALMRTSIVGLTRLQDREHTAEAARLVAELTHADPLALEACILWSEAVRVAVTEHRLDIAGGLDLLPARRRDRWAKWIEEAEDRDFRTFRHNGFTVTALQAAWATIRQTPVPVEDPAAGSFACQHLSQTLQNAIRIGHDTDTVAAIAGGLLGAYWGQSAVPLQWVRELHGWPELRARDLTRLAWLTARQGECDSDGWPLIQHLRYGGLAQPAVRHPLDEGVFLGTEITSDQDATAIVSLFRRGLGDVPFQGIAPENHVEVRLIDSDDTKANPNLAFALNDTAALVKQLRDEGHTVLVHCVRAEQRTPSVAVAYAVHLGASADAARHEIATALPHSRRRGRLWECAADSANKA